MNYLVCPATARYIRFVPTSFVNYIALAVEIYGCDDNFQVEGLYNNINLLIPQPPTSVSF